MGRPGSGSSSHRSSGGGSHRSSGHSTSHSSSHSRPSSHSSFSSSSHSSYSSGHHNPPHHHHYSSGGYSSGYNRGYNDGYRSSSRRSSGGILSSLISIIVALIFIIVLFNLITGKAGNTFKANKIDEEAVTQYAESQYKKLFNDESHLLLVYTYLDKTETDYATLIFGNDASDIISNDLEDYFWNRYDVNYENQSNNESQWLGYTFSDTSKKFQSENVKPLNNLKNFNKGCYDDGLKWIKSNEKSALINGCEEFYKQTGIQPYIILINYKDVPGVEIQQSTAGKFGTTLVIGIIVIVIAGAGIIITTKIINQRKKEQEDLERTLNTPIDSNNDNN